MNVHEARRDGGLTSIQIAFIAVAVALLLVIGYAVYAATSGGGDPTASSSPTASSTSSAEPSSGPSASETAGVPATWADVDPADLPAMVADPQPGEPPARAWAGWIASYVDATWDFETWGKDNPSYTDYGSGDPFLYQALYVVAPTGERFRVHVLPNDVNAQIAVTAPDEGVAWVIYYGYEEFQTVQYTLATDTIDTTWAHDGFTNVSATDNQNGWFVDYLATLSDGRMMWEGGGFGGPINGVFFRAPGGAITASAINPNLGGGYEYAPYCVGVATNVNLAIYEGYTFAEGQPVANWPARLLIHDLATDTWQVRTRLGPYGSPCHDDFSATATYYIGYANRVDQMGLFRYYFDGSPDQPA